MTQPGIQADTQQPGAVEMAEVVLASPLELDGVRYEPDSVVSLPLTHGNGPYRAPNARQLVNDGLARWHRPPAQDAQAAEPPPRSAAGSGRDVRAAHAAAVGVPVTDDMTRDDIAAVDAATTKENRA